MGNQTEVGKDEKLFDSPNSWFILATEKGSNVYLCVCKAISEDKLREALSQTGGSVSDALSRLGFGKDCGTCVIGVENTLRELKNEALRTPLKPKKL